MTPPHSCSAVDSRATNATIDIPAPHGLDYLPYQRAGVAFALQRPGTLIADEMGLGKTVQALGVLNSDVSGPSSLLIVPASLRINWLRECQRWLARPLSVGLTTTRPKKGEPRWPDTDIVIINYDIVGKFQKQISGRHWNNLILDEAHYVKNRKTLRFKQVGLIQADRKVFLTGTPITNRPRDLYTLVRLLDPMEWREKYWEFALRYCNAHKKRVRTRGGMMREVWDDSGASRLGELNERLHNSIMIRRLKADVLPDLPPKRRQVVELPADGLGTLLGEEWEELAPYRAGIDASLAALGEADGREAYEAAVSKLAQAVNQIPFETMARVRSDLAVAKAPLCIQMVRDDLDAVDKLVVFAHHRSLIDAIYESFNDDASLAVRLYGGMSDAAKQDAVDRFQNDPRCHLFVGSITAAGIGLTLTAASNVRFAELDWTPANIAQAEDRCHRIGQRESVNIQHWVVEGSLDAYIAHMLVRKGHIQDKAIN